IRKDFLFSTAPQRRAQKSVADFQRPQALEQNQINVFPGHAPGKTYFSAHKCETPDAFGIRGFARRGLQSLTLEAQRSGFQSGPRQGAATPEILKPSAAGSKFR
ncbi:MAG TPA: hypothetical protein H9844_01390, partial [Candidatus Evtepia faecigallinarum]|nr:hypothetical protein [Candidatus Evtepia faecigallinarum]